MKGMPSNGEDDSHDPGYRPKGPICQVIAEPTLEMLSA
uniref:Uncharacterized protein n=1 Tax=Arundo donax TaxID=35708 RepID=A0A0A9B544_ARUDO